MELIKDLKMPPFARTIWVSPEAEQRWSSEVQKAAGAFHQLERLTVQEGLRKCTTGHISADKLDSSLRDLAKQGLVFLPRVRVGSYQGFAHSHPPVVQGKPWNWYGPIAKNIADAEEFCAAEERGDHVTIAGLLGYPDCCSKFFMDVWMKGYIDPVWQAAMASVTSPDFAIRTVHIPKYASPIWFGSRYIGLRLVPHMPCSTACVKSKILADIWYSIGKEAVTGVSALFDFLHMPMRWDVLHGIATVTTPIFQIVTNSVASTEKYVVNKHGDFFPEHSAKGLHFPFKKD